MVRPRPPTEQRKFLSETQLSRAIRKALEQLGVWVIRTQTSGRSGPRSVATGEPGMPDLYLPSLGHLEVKRDGEDLSDDQSKWHAKAKAAGVRVETVRSVGEAVAVARRWSCS